MAEHKIEEFKRQRLFEEDEANAMNDKSWYRAEQALKAQNADIVNSNDYKKWKEVEEKHEEEERTMARKHETERRSLYNNWK